LCVAERRGKTKMGVNSSNPKRFRSNFLAHDRLLTDYIRSATVALMRPAGLAFGIILHVNGKA
jgi:hypothetical protein